MIRLRDHDGGGIDIKVVSAVVILVSTVAASFAAPVRPADAQAAPPANSVQAFGAAAQFGPAGGIALNQPLVGMAPTRSGGGYWLVAADGGVFTFGDARYFGSTGGIRLNQPIVGMTATPSGLGYWLVAADGGIFAFGDARYAGSTGGIRLNEPVVGMAPTPSGSGYWLVASDGGVFAFGDARYQGSTGGLRLNSPVTGIARTRTGLGYWLAATDGGVFSFGDAVFRGSAAGRATSAVVGIAGTSSGSGYWLASEIGTVFPFGATDHGGTGTGAGAPVVAIVSHPSGSGYWLALGQRIPAGPGDSGPHVGRMQRRLDSLGYWLGSDNGSFGDLTRQAVYAFEKANGRPVNGFMDVDDQAVLAHATRPRPASTSGDLVEVDETRQLLFIVRAGRAVWTFNTSTGSEAAYSGGVARTPNGNWTVSRQIDAWRTSRLGRLYRPKYFTDGGHAVHGYTSVPPYPASHGCVRVTLPAMDFIWAADLMPLGTPLWVHGSPHG